MKMNYIGLGTHEILADTLLGGRLHASLLNKPYFLKKRGAWEVCLQAEEDGVVDYINTEKIMSLYAYLHYNQA